MNGLLQKFKSISAATTSRDLHVKNCSIYHVDRPSRSIAYEVWDARCGISSIPPTALLTRLRAASSSYCLLLSSVILENWTRKGSLSRTRTPRQDGKLQIVLSLVVLSLWLLRTDSMEKSDRNRKITAIFPSLPMVTADNNKKHRVPLILL